MNTTPEPTWLTLREASERLRISEKTVRRWITAGRLSAVRLGPRLLRVDAASIDVSTQPLSAEAGTDR